MKKFVLVLSVYLLTITSPILGESKIFCQVRPVLNSSLIKEMINLASYYREKGKTDWALKIENYATGWISGAVFRSPEGSMVVTFSSELDTLTDKVNIRFFDERLGWQFKEIPIFGVDHSKDMAFAQLSSKVPIGEVILTLDIPVQKLRNLNLKELGNQLKKIASTLDNFHLTQELKPHLNLGEVSFRKDHPLSKGDSIFSPLVASTWVETLMALENSQPKNGYELLKIWENKSNITTHFKGSEGEVYFTWTLQAGRWTLLRVLNSSGPGTSQALSSNKIWTLEFGGTTLLLDEKLIGGIYSTEFTFLQGGNGFWFGMGFQIDAGMAFPREGEWWGGVLLGPHFRLQGDFFPTASVSPLIYLESSGSLDLLSIVMGWIVLTWEKKLDKDGKELKPPAFGPPFVVQGNIKVGLGLHFSSPENYPRGGDIIFETGIYGANGLGSRAFGGWLFGLKYLHRF